MRLMQKILSHGLLIGFFVATFFGYLYRAELFPQWFGDTARTVSSPAQSQDVEQIASTATQEQQVATERRAPADTALPVTELSGQIDTDVADLPPRVDAGADAPAPDAGGWQGAAGDLPPLAAADTEQAHAQQSAEPATVTPPPEPVAIAPPEAGATWDSTPPPARYRPLDNETVTPPPVLEAPEYAAEPQSGSTRWVPRETAPAVSVQAPAPAVARPEPEPAQAAAVDAQPVPATTTQAAAVEVEEVKLPEAASPEAAASSGPAASDEGEFQQQLAVARGYFWRRDLRGAVQAYQQLTTTWPARADAWGELGNLYLRIGNRQAAAEAYYRTISILLDQGEPDRAYDLLEVLYGLDSGRASELEKRFRKVSS